MLLGSGELGKEFVIAVKRLGQYVIAVDSYNDAPAQQVADAREVINMLDGAELDRIVAKHQPDIIVPEIEAIRTERFYDYEQQQIQVVPSAKAANYTMNRKAIPRWARLPGTCILAPMFPNGAAACAAAASPPMARAWCCRLSAPIPAGWMWGRPRSRPCSAPASTPICWAKSGSMPFPERKTHSAALRKRREPAFRPDA